MGLLTASTKMYNCYEMVISNVTIFFFKLNKKLLNFFIKFRSTTQVDRSHTYWCVPSGIRTQDTLVIAALAK